MSRDNNDVSHHRKLRPEYLNKFLNNGIIEINNDITLSFHIINNRTVFYSTKVEAVLNKKTYLVHYIYFFSFHRLFIKS